MVVACHPRLHGRLRSGSIPAQAKKVTRPHLNEKQFGLVIRPDIPARAGILK
jgi:hypothetical protein